MTVYYSYLTSFFNQQKSQRHASDYIHIISLDTQRIYDSFSDEPDIPHISW